MSPAVIHSLLFEVPVYSVHFLGKLRSRSRCPQHELQQQKLNNYETHVVVADDGNVIAETCTKDTNCTVVHMLVL